MGESRGEGGKGGGGAAEERGGEGVVMILAASRSACVWENKLIAVQRG